MNGPQDGVVHPEHGFNTNPVLKFLYVRTKDVYHIPAEKFDGRHALLLNDVTYTDTVGGRHTAHHGLVTDGGTIPVCFWRVIGGPFVYCLIAYLVHDEYCNRARDVRRMGCAQRDEVLLEQAEKIRSGGDALFLEMLEWIDTHIQRIDVSWWKRRVMYRGVRLAAG